MRGGRVDVHRLLPSVVFGLVSPRPAAVSSAAITPGLPPGPASTAYASREKQASTSDAAHCRCGRFAKVVPRSQARFPMRQTAGAAMLSIRCLLRPRDDHSGLRSLLLPRSKWFAASERLRTPHMRSITGSCGLSSGSSRNALPARRRASSVVKPSAVARPGACGQWLSMEASRQS
jgi:hypothetical protein